MNNLVSIVIPMYNSEKTIQRCVISCINQTYKNIEILLIDDGSKDNTLKKCNDLKEIDDRISIYSHSNSGVSYSRNVGIKKSKGDFIHFVDSDDEIDPRIIEVLLNEINGYDCSICSIRCFHKNKVSDKNIHPGKYCNLNELDYYFEEYYQNSIFHSPVARLYRKDKITKYFDENISYGEDLLFNLNYFTNNNRISIVDEPLYHYFIQQKSLTFKLHDDELNTIKKIYNNSKDFYLKNVNADGENMQIILKFALNNLSQYVQKIYFCDCNYNDKMLKIKEIRDDNFIIGLLNEEIAKDYKQLMWLKNDKYRILNIYFKIKKIMKRLVGR